MKKVFLNESNKQTDEKKLAIPLQDSGGMV